RVSPLCPFCPPGGLPDCSRKLLTRAGFFSPSLDGGLPLFELFNPSRRSSSVICAFRAAISAACAAISAMSSSREGPAGESAFIESLNRSPIPMSSKTYRLDFAKTPTQPGQEPTNLARCPVSRSVPVDPIPVLCSHRGGGMDGKFIAYYRVSTDHQGVNGNGIAAQRKAVEDYLNGGRWKLVGEFTEVESGKRSDRPELEKALTACRKHKAKLVIAKLDRLSRNVHFISGLMEP